jgi:hypothetical protein
MLTAFFYVEEKSETDENKFRGSLSKRQWRKIAPNMGFRVEPGSPLAGFWNELQHFYISPTQSKFEELQATAAELVNELHGAENNAGLLVSMSLARISEKHGWQLAEKNPCGKTAAQILKGETEPAKYIADDARVDLLKLDLWWMSYFATGDEAYLDKISHYTTLPIEDNNLGEREKKRIFKAALWSIQYNCREHEAVKRYFFPQVD